MCVHENNNYGMRWRALPGVGGRRYYIAVDNAVAADYTVRYFYL